MAAPQLGTGATATYTALTGPLMSIDMNLYSRESVQTSHLGTTTAHTYIPGSLYDPGEITLELQVETGVAYGTPATASASSLVIAWTTGVSVTASAFMTGLSWNIPLEELQICTATFKLTGAITIDSTP
jgi:hypothetical protein